MSEYRTVFRPEAQAELRKIPRETTLRLLAKLTELEGDPFDLTASEFRIDSATCLPASPTSNTPVLNLAVAVRFEAA
ncbi:type II toxin-antitoxin system RelE/ParE family toxin [Streptomyces sp. NPDC056796]|uniref:type II toxin-antitoxin system RelE family toxin n=1 Tax=Streptomyces sp. NPDC056796 TaxID=3345947 RepID=UPI0036926FD1